MEAKRFKESEERFRTLVNTIPDLIWLKDINGVYLGCNKMVESLFGVVEKDMIGKTDYDFVDKELADSFKEYDRIAAEKGGPSYNEEWVTFADGGKRLLLDKTKVPMYDSSRQLIGILGIARDITKRRQAEEQRLLLEEQLRQKSKIEAIGLLAGGMAHNFNNNLSIVLGNLELLGLTVREDKEALEYINNAKIGVSRSRELIQQIMAYSRSGMRTKEAVNLFEIVTETLKLLKAAIPSTVYIQYNPLPENEQAIILANETSIQEALLNLCNNAVHAMEERGTLSILTDKVTLQQADIPQQYEDCCPGGFVRLRVKDTGCGIESELLDKIFDPFFTTKDVNTGTGMGLATVQGMVKELGGMIRVSSSIGQGTTFELYFPLSDHSLITVNAVTDEPFLKGHERILIVDDDQMIATMEERMFSEMGYQVTTMTESLEAMKLFKTSSEHFDLVITDQTMPHMTGKELIQEMLKINPNLPTIICTGYSNTIDQADADRIGIRKLLVKPIPLPDLLHTARTILDEAKDQTA